MNFTFILVILVTQEKKNISYTKKLNTMENTVICRAKEFLQNVNKDELKELVFANELEFFPEDHIMRKFVDYTYQDIDITIGFILGMSALYPFIAQEAYRRFDNMLDIPYCEH